MKPANCTIKEHFIIRDSERVHSETKRIKKILDASYKKANLTDIVEALTHLNKTKQDKLFNFLKKYVDMFDGTLGTYTGSDYK